MSTTTSPHPGISGQGLKFDNTNDNILFSNWNAIENLSSLSVSVWVKSTVPTKNTTDIILGQYGAGDETMQLSWDSGDNVVFQVRDSADSGFSASYVNGILDTEWHHIVGVLDGDTDTVKVYVDTNVGSNVATFTDVTNESTNIFRISSATATFPGTIDEIRVYNRALSAQEIDLLYRMGGRH